MKRQEQKSINSHTLWLELINQRTPNTVPVTKSKTINNGILETDRSKSFYKTQEEYYDESIFLKKNIASLKGENDILKSRIRKDEDELSKKDKQMSEIISCIENQKATQDSSVNNFIVVKKLKQSVFHLKSEIKGKENEILQLKSDVKFTKINEMKIQNETYLQEVKSLQQLISNSYYKDLSAEESRAPNANVTKPKPAKSNQKSSVVKKNKELTMENKMLKKEVEKNDQAKLSENDGAKTSSVKKNEDFILEIDRLKKACKDINQEKNEMQSKYEDMCAKYKALEESLEKKDTEVNSLKKRSDEKAPTKNELPTKGEKAAESDRNQNLELVQSVCRAYLSREKIIENTGEESSHDEQDLSKADLVQSAFLGYAMRQKALCENDIDEESSRDKHDLSKSDILQTAFLGYVMRQKMLAN